MRLVQAFQVTDGSGVAQARRGVATLAGAIGFNERDVGRASLVATEIATNLLKHGRGGELLAEAVGNEEMKGLELLGLDKGSGMADPGKCLIDGYSTTGSPGTGLGAISRLSQCFDIYSLPGKGTGVLARLWPHGKEARKPDELDVGAVVVAKPGETVCGDAWSWVHRPGGALVLGADGLGHGPLAAEASITATRIFDARRDRRPAAILQDIHAALRATRGAAAAVADIDFEGRTVSFASIGNLAGTLLTAGNAKKMMSDNGIVGHQARKFRETSYPCTEDTIFILHSDGLGTSWQMDRYPGLALRRSSLIAGVLYRDFTRGRDDTLVVVAKRTRP